MADRARRRKPAASITSEEGKLLAVVAQTLMTILDQAAAPAEAASPA